jgi:hypothetical protein
MMINVLGYNALRRAKGMRFVEKVAAGAAVLKNFAPKWAFSATEAPRNGSFFVTILLCACACFGGTGQQSSILILLRSELYGSRLQRLRQGTAIWTSYQSRPQRHQSPLGS